MKIAITSQNKKDVTGHAGRCRKFWIYNLENNKVVHKELLEIPREMVFHNHRDENHPIDGVDMLLTGGMGNGLRKRMHAKGIQALIIKETHPDKAIELFLNEELEFFLPDPNHQCSH